MIANLVKLLRPRVCPEKVAKCYAAAPSLRRAGRRVGLV